MARDSLDTLLRIRKLAVDAAIRDLGVALRESEQARLALAALTDVIPREHAVARDLANEVPGLAVLPGWRARRRELIAQARVQLSHADQAVAAAQDALGQARGATRAVEAAVERRAAEARVVAARGAQHELDDVARRKLHRHEG